MATSTISSPDGLAERLEQAVDWLRNDKLPEADRALTQILVQWPGQPDALHFQGVLRHNQGRSEEGLTLIRQALEQIPEHAGAWTNLGNILLTSGHVDEAVQAYERSIQAAGGQAEAASPLCNLSTIYRKQGRGADAEAACRHQPAVWSEESAGQRIQHRGDGHPLGHDHQPGPQEGGVEAAGLLVGRHEVVGPVEPLALVPGLGLGHHRIGEERRERRQGLW